MDTASSVVAHSGPECPGRVIWSFTSSILVFGMIPGLAFFEAGLVRSKNTVSVITQVISGHSILTVLWVMIGYSLTFGEDAYGAGIVGNLDHVFLLGVSMEPGDMANGCDVPMSRGSEVLYELMFATISPLLMTGAYAERLRYRQFLMLTLLWELLIYYPVAHWVWSPKGFLAVMGVQDFAGGIVIHATSGVSALLLAWMLGKRCDFDKYDGNYPPSNMPLFAIGGAMLWFGWGGFNAGGADGGARSNLALLNTHVAAALSSMVWLFLSMKFKHKARATAVMNGAIAGLAGITPAAGYVSLQSGMLCGVLIGFASYGAAIVIRDKLKIDDALDVSAVHGVSGIVGSLFVGPFDQTRGGLKLFGVQILGTLLCASYAFFCTMAIVGICIKLQGSLRITEDEEHQGLDVVEHQEIAYHGHNEAEDVHNASPIHASPRSRVKKFSDQPQSESPSTVVVMKQDGGKESERKPSSQEEGHAKSLADSARSSEGGTQDHSSCDS